MRTWVGGGKKWLGGRWVVSVSEKRDLGVVVGILNMLQVWMSLFGQYGQ